MVLLSVKAANNRLTLSQRQILDPSRSKECANANFKFYENCRKFSKRVENTERKGKNACYLSCRHVKARACLGNNMKFFNVYD